MFHISKNRKKVKYKNKIFSFNSKLSLEKNFKAIHQLLKKPKKKRFSLMDGLIPEAHAEGSYGGSLESASLDILMLLSYLQVYGNGEDFYGTLMYIAENDQNGYQAILRLFESQGRKRIKKISCGDSSAGPLMKIEFEDGSFGESTWNGVQGDGTVTSLVEKQREGNWGRVKLYTEDEKWQVLNGQFFFCQMMGGGNTANDLAVIASLNEMIAPGSYEDHGDEPVGSGSLD